MSLRQLPLFPSESEHALTRGSSLADAIPPFLEHLRQEGCSGHTIKSFASDLRLVEEFFGSATELRTFTTTGLRRFLHWLEHERGVPCSRKSYARRVTTLKVFFKFLKKEHVLAHDPAEALLQRSGAAPLQPVLNDEEVARLLSETATRRFADKPDARPELLVRLLLDTGIKKSECMRLTLDDIRREKTARPQVTIRHKKPNNVFQERRIALDPDWLQVLDEYIEQYAPSQTIFDCTARNLEYILHDIATSAGVKTRVSFEIFRWTSAVRDYLRGMELDDLREKMGLSRISWRETRLKIIQLATTLREGTSDVK